jgi:hypothetical protein
MIAIGTDTAYLPIALLFALAGFGQGLAIPATMAAALEIVPRQRSGVGSAIAPRGARSDGRTDRADGATGLVPVGRGRASFWSLTGGWSRLGELLERDPRVALVVDACDLDRGEVLQVAARGTAELHPFEVDRARSWGRRYLGPDERHWRRFQGEVFDDPATRFVALKPRVVRARDLSY